MRTTSTRFGAPTRETWSRWHRSCSAVRCEYLGERASQVPIERSQNDEIERKIADLETAAGERVADGLKAGIDPKLLKAAADTINQELDSLRRHRDQLATWAKASADQSDRMRKLWKVAQTAHQRLGTLNIRERKHVLELLDIRAAVVAQPTRSSPAQIEITGTVTETIGEALGGDLSDVAPTRPSCLRFTDVEGKRIIGFRRMGKRIVWELDDDLFMVFHLMVSGRFHWKNKGIAVPKKVGHAGFDFENGTLLLTEQSTKKRASLFVHRGEQALEEHERGGAELLEIDRDSFARTLTRENRTMKRALTDPRIFSGIGNAYSDEILLKAKLSPVRRTSHLDDEEITRLYEATQASLLGWTDAMRQEVGDGFPEKVTAFRKDMGGTRKIRRALPGLWKPRAAHRVRIERNQLLRDMSERWEAARGSITLAPAEGRLAQNC